MRREDKEKCSREYFSRLEQFEMWENQGWNEIKGNIWKVIRACDLNVF